LVKADKCDAAGRHRFDKIIRLLELQAVLRGDCGIMKLADGRVQGIEGDRIRNPLGTPYADPTWIHGVRVNEAGKAQVMPSIAGCPTAVMNSSARYPPKT
jgi:hypothetical protein